MLNFPARVKIGLHTYDISFDPVSFEEFESANGEPVFGWVDSSNLTIHLKGGVPASLTRETLAHEIGHVLYERIPYLPSRAYEREEAIVDVMSYGWVQVLVENPAILALFADDPADEVPHAAEKDPYCNCYGGGVCGSATSLVPGHAGSHPWIAEKAR